MCGGIVRVGGKSGKVEQSTKQISKGFRDLAQSVEHVTLDLGVMSPNPMLGIEIT